MDCQQVHLMLSGFQDGHVLDLEREEIASHLKACPECATRYSQMEAVRASIQALPKTQIPAHLALTLRVIASREAHRRRRYDGLRGWIRSYNDRLQLFAQNLMRPLAIPAAGGLLSAVFLFSMVMTNYQGIVRQPHNDIPTILATSAVMKASLFSAEEITVDVLVDEQGRVIDFTLPEDEAVLEQADPELRRKLGNSLLFAQFQPATSFGRPTTGWVKVTYRCSFIDVKG
jgi:hypothetical protein